MKNEVFTLSFLMICLFASCNTKFDKQGWSDSSDDGFPPTLRSHMLKDLTANHKLVGLTCSQLIHKLDSPDYKNGTSMTYKIIIDYGFDIDPVYTKNLEFVFSKDSVIRSFKIDEWKK